MPKRSTKKPKSRTSGSPAVTLPVVQPRGLRPKRPSLWRTLSLIGVHLVMIAHVAQWLIQGTTLSPVEPSEAMEFSKHGVVNTGLVFFVAAIAVTAVFGRFFCGWGCHLIALQDLSRWLLIKMGIRPRSLRSRLLGLVPMVAFVYMFLWPLAYRVGVGESLGNVSAGFFTGDFWATFPGLTIAVLTFVVCGFAVVFVLGSKGYCAYGCPYGAAFSLADKVAPIRVRVTDACRSCATCTAVCTSNVRVHEEVRDHKMVVDPGCMKCLDCVANCPNEALYVGSGRPALGAARAWSGRGALSWPEEVIAGLAFVGSFAVFRGLYDLVPFLFSLGIAAIYAGLAVVAWRFLSESDAWLGPVRLKAGGRVRRAGWVFAVVAASLVGMWAHSGVVRVLDARAGALYDRTAGLRMTALDLQREAIGPSTDDLRRVVDARAAILRLESWSLVPSPSTELQLAWLALLDGDRSEAKTRVDRVLRQRSTDPQAHLLAARLLVSDGRFQDAASAYGRVVELDGANPLGYLGLGTVLGRAGQLEAAGEVFSRGSSAHPESADLRYNHGVSLALSGDLAGAEMAFRAALELDSEHLPARENLGGVLAAGGRFDEAVPILEEAIRRSPDDAELRLMTARVFLGAGRRAEAAEQIEIAVGLDPRMEAARELLD